MNESDTDAQEAAPPVILSEHEIAALRAAGRWARLVGGAGSVILGLFTLLIIDVAVKNPQGVTSVANAQGLGVATTVLDATASLVAVALLWGYGRNVAAFFMRGDPELRLAFRRIRQFFILWTYLSVATAVIGVLSALIARTFVRF
jgi:hypothetical protein